MAPPQLGRDLWPAFFLSSCLISRSPGSIGTGSLVVRAVGVLATTMRRGLPELVVGVAMGMAVGMLAFPSERREPL